ncbi:hypothetical protein PR202_gb08059 [Eleusine coracana subsp. coracana]|uniref:Uncharacterized protein n=1 Tax=Eleusine coracana subsp. coracana TaxID=191504 RepID=A0AAV5EDS0_ELECO|nr:hypothetical protein PR202_gb08059 [Eleusine coracana subsp. coracana]
MIRPLGRFVRLTEQFLKHFQIRCHQCMSDESPSASNQEMEPHTPDMPTFTRAPFDSDDLPKDGVGMSPQHFTSKRNGTHPEEISALSSREGLKLFNDLSSSSEKAPRSGFDGKVRKGLTFESPEVKGKDGISNDMANLQQEISRLLAESQIMKQQISSESERANKAENEIQILKETVLQLNSDKDKSLLQCSQSTAQISTLESELCKAQADLRKLTDEMATDVQKLINVETLNIAMKSEVEGLDQKMRMQQQELEQKLEELESFRLSFQEEHEKRMQADTALVSQKEELARSHQEVQRLTIEIKMANEKLNALKLTKEDLEDTVSELKKDVESLTEQNHSSKLLIQQLRDEIITLKDSKNELQTEIKGLKSTISLLTTEKNAALLQHEQSVKQVLIYETQLSKLQSELEEIEQKVQILMQDLEKKREEVNTVHAQLQDECHRRTETEATLLTTLELEKSEEKVKLLELEVAKKNEIVNSLELSLKDEGKKKLQAQASLDSMEKMYSQSQDDINGLHLEIEKLNGKLNELEKLSSELKSTILLLNAEKNAALLENQQSSARLSDLEPELVAVKAELENVEGKAQMLEKELRHKKEEADSLQINLQDESQKRAEGEASLLLMTNLRSESQEEVNRLALEIEKLTGNISDLENSKVDLENTVAKHTEEIHILREQNLSTELMIKGLHRELDGLKELNVKLESEMGLHIGEKEALHRDFACQREQKENLEGIHHALVDEMGALKTSAAAKEKLIEELQIMNSKLKDMCEE